MGRGINQIAGDRTFIYGLFDPRKSDAIRYVGQTCRSVAYRLYEHKRAARTGSLWPVSCWLRSLEEEGIEPQAVTLEIVPDGGDWRLAECRWIEMMRERQGENRLLNLSLGGDGVRGVVASSETRAKRSQAMKAIWASGGKKPSNLGRKFSAEARLSMSLAHRGKPGRKWSEEERANRAKRKRRSMTAQQRECVRQGHLNSSYIATPEHRAKLSEATRLVWERRRAYSG